MLPPANIYEDVAHLLAQDSSKPYNVGIKLTCKQTFRRGMS